MHTNRANYHTQTHIYNKVYKTRGGSMKHVEKKEGNAYTNNSERLYTSDANGLQRYYQ